MNTHNNIGLSSAITVPLPAGKVAAPAAVKKEAPAAQDSVEIKGRYKSIAAGIAHGSGRALLKGLEGLALAPQKKVLETLGLDQEPECAKDRLIKYAIQASPAFALGISLSLINPAAAVVLSLAAPGVAGALYKGIGAMKRGWKRGYIRACRSARKMKKRIADRLGLGKTAGGVAMGVTGAIVGAVAIPLTGAAKFIKSTFNFSNKVIKSPSAEKKLETAGARKSSKNFISRLKKIGKKIGTAVVPALIVIIPDIFILGGVLAVGGAASTYTGIKAGAKNAVAGFREGYNTYQAKHKEA